MNLARASRFFQFALCFSAEKNTGLAEKFISLTFTLVGLYPQYKTVQTVLRGRGLLGGDWRREHKFNNLNIYMIEPLCESMLQVMIMVSVVIWSI